MESQHSILRINQSFFVLRLFRQKTLLERHPILLSAIIIQHRLERAIELQA